MKTIKAELPAAWASYLINDDCSGLEHNEAHEIHACLEDMELNNCIDVSEETFPLRFNGLLTECATYTFIEQ
jgi:hypothetical protein